MKYKVVIGTLFVDGVKYRRGDIIETDQDLGTRVEPVVEASVVEEVKPKPKRKRRTKAEIAQDEEAERSSTETILSDIPAIGGSNEDR